MHEPPSSMFREHCNASRTNRFYRLVAVGLGSTYAAQIFLNDRRRHQADSDDGRDASACELRRKFAAQYDDYVCDRTGVVYAAAG